MRSLVHELLANPEQAADWPQPRTRNRTVAAAAAAIAELLAARRGETPPAWIDDAPPLSEPVFLVKAAASMPRLRALCETQSPEPLRKRGFLAPPNFLEFA